MILRFGVPLYLEAPKGYLSDRMHSSKGTLFGSSRLAAVPLAVAYAAVPLGTALVRYMGDSPTMPPDLPWLLLAGIGGILAMHRPTPDASPGKGFFFKSTLFLLLVIGLVFYWPDLLAGQGRSLAYLRECSPVAYLLLGILWASTCGLPDRGDFQRYGALLGALCVADLALEVFTFHAVPTVRFLGNADILAGLLIVSLCAGLKPGGNQGGAHEPDQGRVWWRGLVMLGLLACLSRTGLFGSAWVVLCFGRGKFRYRAFFSSVCVLLLVGTFFLPPTLSDAVRYTDYWLWVEAVRLFSETPLLLLTGFPVDVPLPVHFPIGMGAVWEAATGMPATFGAFLTQVPSFWLRLVLAWGMFPPLLLLGVLFALLLRHLTRMGAGLTAALFAQGMTTPLLFDPPMGVAITLAFVLALTPGALPSNTRKAPFSPEPVSPDPVEEWDMRPV